MLAKFLRPLKLDGVDPAFAAEVFDRASTVATQALPAMVAEAFDLIGNILELSQADRQLIAAVKKSWESELQRRSAHSQTARPKLWLFLITNVGVCERGCPTDQRLPGCTRVAGQFRFVEAPNAVLVKRASDLRAEGGPRKERPGSNRHRHTPTIRLKSPSGHPCTGRWSRHPTK